MNKVAYLCVFAAAALSAVAQDVQAPVRRRPSRPSGGAVAKTVGGDKVLAIRDCQSLYTQDEVAAAVQYAKDCSHLSIVCVKGDAAVGNSAAEVQLVDEGLRAGASILAAPEQGWASLAVKTLVSDAPAADLRLNRLKMELLRTVASALGVGLSMYQPCLMTTVRGLKDLDALKLRPLGPEGVNNIETSAKSLGIGQTLLYSYRTACQQGWAPAPTNDVQKAIWDETHALPKTPMKIEFDPKKGK